MPVVDGLMATVRLLEYLAVRAMPLSEIVRYLPPMHLVKGSVHTPWDAKGGVMRRVNDAYKASDVETVDGIKVWLPDDAWVHISPHSDKPTVEIVAEARSQKLAEAIVRQAVEQVERSRDNGI